MEQSPEKIFESYDKTMEFFIIVCKEIFSSPKLNEEIRYDLMLAKGHLMEQCFELYYKYKAVAEIRSEI